MTASITITMSEDLLKTLLQTKELTIELGTPTSVAAGGPKASGRATPISGGFHSPDGFKIARPGSLPDKVIQWASKKKRHFTTQEVVKQFKLTRGHASMLLSKLVSEPYPVERAGRGIYIYTG